EEGVSVGVGGERIRAQLGPLDRFAVHVKNTPANRYILYESKTGFEMRRRFGKVGPIRTVSVAKRNNLKPGRLGNGVVQDGLFKREGVLAVLVARGAHDVLRLFHLLVA